MTRRLKTVDAIRAHYRKLRLTKDGLIEQLAQTEYLAEQLKQQIEDEHLAQQGMDKRALDFDGLHVDLERLRKGRDGDRERIRELQDELRTLKADANARMDERQRNQEHAEEQAATERQRADWFQEQRDQLAGIVEGMRGDCIDKGKRRRLDKVLAGLTQRPVVTSHRDFAAPDPMVMEHGPGGWRRR